MKTLPNGIRVFNATPHAIRFWREGWAEPVEIETDVIINASVSEIEVSRPSSVSDNIGYQEVSFVKTRFAGNAEGEEIIENAIKSGVDLIIGSIIAAQAYPGRVVAMTPAPGYERVAPAEKRMNPDKFTLF